MAWSRVQGLGFVLLLPHAAEDAKNMRLAAEAVGEMLVQIAAFAHAPERNWQVGGRWQAAREARHG
jgi:hypothetical protein